MSLLARLHGLYRGQSTPNAAKRYQSVLLSNYRCHPAILRLPAGLFYDSSLQVSCFIYKVRQNIILLYLWSPNPIFNWEHNITMYLKQLCKFISNWYGCQLGFINLCFTWMHNNWSCFIRCCFFNNLLLTSLYFVKLRRQCSICMVQHLAKCFQSLIISTHLCGLTGARAVSGTTSEYKRRIVEGSLL